MKPENRIAATTILGWLFLTLLMLAHACDSYGQDVPKEEKVRARPVSAEFMAIVSMCLDDALWDQHSNVSPGQGEETPEMGSLRGYLFRMKTCLLQAELGEIAREQPLITPTPYPGEAIPPGVQPPILPPNPQDDDS